MHLLQHRVLYCLRLSDRFAEHIPSVRNNDVDKPVERHFNTSNHSMSGIKVCAISPISGCNDSRKWQEKRLIFKIGTIHPLRLNQRFFIWSLHSFCFCRACVQTNAVTSHLFTPLFMFIHLPLIHFAPPPPRLRPITFSPFLLSYVVNVYLLPWLLGQPWYMYNICQVKNIIF